LYTLFFSNFIFSEDCGYSEEDGQFHDNNFRTYSKNLSGSETGNEPAPMANLDGEPSAYVHGCVNIITGMYCDFNTDLVVHHGTDPLRFERSFAGCTIETSIGGGWQSNHSCTLDYKKCKRSPQEQIVRSKKGKKIYGDSALYGDDHGAKALQFFDPHSREPFTRFHKF